MTAITILKALHVIGFIFWLGGLLILYRLFVVAGRSGEESADRQGIKLSTYHHLQRDVYKRLVNPGMMLTWFGGLLVLLINPSYLNPEVGTSGWMHVKLVLLFGLLLFHLFSKRLMLRMQRGEWNPGVSFLLILTSIPMLFLTGIVFLAVLGKAGILNYVYWGTGLVLFFILSILRNYFVRRNRTSL